MPASAYNFVLQGNPGTGKTEVARLLGRILHSVGVRKESTFVQTTGEELVRNGAAVANWEINAAENGVLFIDEAYGLEPASSPEGKAITLQLLDAAENYRDSLTIIFAGYPDDLQSKLFDFNDGFTSRFPFQFTFHDYVASELQSIFSLYCEKSHCAAADTVVRLVGSTVQRGRGRKGFGNARTVRSVFERARDRMKVRLPMDAPLELTAEDILGPRPSRDSPPTLKAALDSLEELTGLERVKERIYALVDLAEENYQRQLDGEEPRDVVLNTVFLGNPGTGKTTVAKLYGTIVGACGLLSKGGAVLRKGSDLIGNHVGETHTKVTKLLKQCEGKVLIIDEAYALHKATAYGQEAIDTLIGSVHGAPGEDIAVVMLGYEKEMQDMMNKTNPGLASRFNLNKAYLFDDYSDEELHVIMQRFLKKKGLKLASPEVAEEAVRHLSLQRSSHTFGNARTVESFITDSMHAMAARDRASKSLTLADLGLERAPPNLEAAFKPLEELDNVDKIRDHLKQLCARIQLAQRENKPLSGVIKNYLFVGNPGTGKTTVAKAFGDILFELGCLERAHVESQSAQSLQAGYVGQTSGRVRDAVDHARGGVLVLDEAHTLAGRGSFASEVVDELTELMTSPAHKGRTVIVLAAPTDKMNQMLRAVNPGFASRFTERLEFVDWSPHDCVKSIARSIQKRKLTIDATALRTLEDGLTVIRGRPGWANARDCVQTLEFLEDERAARQFGNDADTQPRTDCTFDFTNADAVAVCAKWLSMRPLPEHDSTAPQHPEVHFVATSDAHFAAPPSPVPGPHAHAATVSFKEREQTHIEVLENHSEEETEQQEECKMLTDDGEDPILTALLQACQEAGYDASHEKRQELVGILEAVESHRGKLPATICERIKSQVPHKPWPAIEQSLLPQIPIVLKGMRNAVAAEEAHREEMRRLVEEERLQKERELEAQRQKLQRMGVCCMGYTWHPEGDGWRCAGGSHFVRSLDL